MKLLSYSKTGVFLPPQLELLSIQEQANLMKEAFANYRTQFCDEKGNIKKSNLTPAQQDGKNKLRRRVKRLEIVVGTTDKSGKYVVTTPEIYRYAAYKHVEKSQLVSKILTPVAE